ncbi:MAG: PAS domain S-box protein [Desulfobacterales bacterium]|nr:PAS domain S-box protein [Desulfobacterales bacterium]
MNRIAQFFKGSIINKAIFLIALILSSVGGILAVNAISFFDVKGSLESLIDRDVRQVIENTRLNDNFISSVAESDLLFSTFTEHKNTLTAQKDRLIDKLNAGISSSMLTETDSKTNFEGYIADLNKLFAACAIINDFLIEIDTIEKSLDTELARLDEIVVEEELTAVVEGTEETDSIKQLAIMLPGYREIYFEIILNFIHAKNAYLGSNAIDQNYEQKILGLLEEFDIGLKAIPIAWAEIKPRVQNLIELTSRYKSQINKIFKSLRAFHDQLGALRHSQREVLAETSKINHQIVANTHAIRKQTSANVASSIRTTIMLSSIIIIILLVIGLFTVRLVHPIKMLSIGALKVGAGNLDYKVKIDSNDEIGHLAEAFNGMTDSLRKTTVSKEYVENILKSINEMLITLTPTGRIQSVNQATCDLLGYQAEELVGESAGRIFEDAEDIRIIDKKRKPKSVIEKLVAQQEIRNDEKTWWDKEGRAISVLFSASAILDNDDNLQGFVCVASDITERKQAEEALKISEANYRRLFDAEPDAIIITDSETKRIVDANPAALKLYGYSYDEMCGRQAVSLSAEPQKSARHIQQIVSEETMVATGEIVQRQHKSKDGTVFPVEIAHGFYIRNGRKMICAIMRNISRRKRMADELAAEKERLSVTLRSIGDGVISTDLQGNVISVNEIAEELTGWKEEEAVGKPLTNVFHIVNELNRQLCEDPVRKVMETGGIVGLANNTILVSRDGQEHVIADSAAPIMDSQQKIIGAVLVFRDITEKRKIEEELVKIQKLESLGVLAGGIAHDFNNFLTAIIGNLSLAMLDSKPGDQVVARLKEMEKASLQAKDLTQQLLTFSKGGEPVKKLVNFVDLVKHSATFSLRGSNVRCEFSIAENLRPAEVDEGQIGQVINNLVLNADHAMPEGGILKICAENIVLLEANEFSLPAGPYIKTTLRDHGVGIPIDLLPKVFDPYFTTKHKGSGLGLTVAYSIIDKHNGRLTADSVLGKHTTFTIYLPASEKLEIQTENNAKVLFAGEGKILLMDDEDFIREVASQMLYKLGYEVSVAKDGNEAIEIYRQAQQSKQPFDAVIMDLTVPGGMGGKEAIQKLKALDPNIKALVSSGYSNDPIMSNFRDYGFKGVVKKPYLIQDMSDALQSVISEITK